MRYIKTYESHQENTFKEWLSNKLGIKIGRKLGNGLYGVVYELPNKKVSSAFGSTPIFAARSSFSLSFTLGTFNE